LNERGEPRRWLVLAMFLGVCALADASPVLKLRPPSVVLGALIGAIDGPRADACFALLVAAAVGAPALATGWVARRRWLPRGGRARFLGASIVVAMFAGAWLLGPRAAALQAIGRGSDQAACIMIPARALASGHWPYERGLIWSANPCSPGMGWILLAAPFVVVSGYAGFLVAGAAAFVLLPERTFGASAATAFLVLTLSCVTAWQSLATGADALALGIALALVTAMSHDSRSTVLVAVLAGLLGSARLPFAFFPFVLAASMFAGGERRRASLFLAVAMASLGLAHGVPLALDACSYLQDGPFHVLRKAVRLERGGGPWVFVACGLAWLGYAAWILRRALGGAAGAASPVGRQLDVATLTLFCVLAPALADLFPRVGADPMADASEALDGWQGGNWLLLALPGFAASVALAFRGSPRDASPPADTSSLRAT
jgi:hypothetical protein